jgi:hypothetical protein
MRKTVFAAFSILIIGGAGLAYGQQSPAPSDDTQRPRFTAEDHGAFTDANIAALKAGLRLTPSQEKMWPPVEQSLRDLVQKRLARAAERRERREGRGKTKNAVNPIERLRHASEVMSEHAAGLRTFADAAQPLYDSLDDAQKRRLRVLLRTVRTRDMPFASRRERGREDKERR